MTVLALEPFAGGPLLRAVDDDGLLHVTYGAGHEEHRNRRHELIAPAQPPYVRLGGPLGGIRHVTPAELRHEARRLLDAADTLDTILDACPYAQPTTQEDPDGAT